MIVSHSLDVYKHRSWAKNSISPSIFFFLAVKREPVVPEAPPKSALSEEELEKKAKAIIEEYLHINDMKVNSKEWGLSQSRACWEWLWGFLFCF